MSDDLCSGLPYRHCRGVWGIVANDCQRNSSVLTPKCFARLHIHFYSFFMCNETNLLLVKDQSVWPERESRDQHCWWERLSALQRTRWGKCWCRRAGTGQYQHINFFGCLTEINEKQQPSGSGGYLGFLKAISEQTRSFDCVFFPPFFK